MHLSMVRFLKNPKTWQAALAGYWLLLFVATHLPSQTTVLPQAGVDKLIHVAAFALLAGLLATAWHMTAGHLTLRHLIWLWLAVVLYAAVDEWTQIPVGRIGSVADWVADAAGAILALAAFALWQRCATERQQR
jgi:VanZ family protein